MPHHDFPPRAVPLFGTHLRGQPRLRAQRHHTVPRSAIDASQRRSSRHAHTEAEHTCQVHTARASTAASEPVTLLNACTMPPSYESINANTSKRMNTDGKDKQKRHFTRAALPQAHGSSGRTRKSDDVFHGDPSMGPLGGAPGAEKRHLEGKMRFWRFLWKNAIAGIFGQFTAIAKRDGVQAKRAFCDHRRDFWCSNILNTENSTDSGDTPKNACFPMVLGPCPAPYVTFCFFTRCGKMPSFSKKSGNFWPRAEMREKSRAPPEPRPREPALDDNGQKNYCPSKTPRR